MTLSEKQEKFMEYLQDFQETAVSMSLPNGNATPELVDKLYEATYYALYSVCEFLDGYSGEELGLELVEKGSGITIHSGIEFHDECMTYLKLESPYKK